MAVTSRIGRKGRAVLAAFTAVAGASGAAMGVAGAASTSTIQGHVLFDSTGAVPASAEVCYASEWPYIPTCVPVDPVTGSYSITGLDAGIYQVSAQSTSDEFVIEYLDGTYDQFSSAPAEIDGSSNSTINFTVARGASISGTVTHEGTIDPIGNVVVCAEGMPFRCTTTAADGTYKLTALPQQPTILRFTPDGESGYFGEVWDDQVDGLDATAITFATPTEEVTGIDAQLSKGGTISGIVTDEETGAPLTTFTVCAYGASGAWSLCQTIDPLSSMVSGLPAGGYQFTSVPPDDYSLSFFSQPSYLSEFWDDQRTPENAGTVTIVGEAAVTADAALAPLHGVFGTVFDASATFPLPGARVCAYQGSTEVSCVVADEYGTFMFSDLAAGTYTLGVPSQEGFLPQYWNGAASLDAATTFEVVDGVDNAPFEFRLIQDPEAIPDGEGEPILTPEADTGGATNTGGATTSTVAPTTTSTVATAPATTTSTTVAGGSAATTAPSSTTTPTTTTTTPTAARVLGAQQAISSPQARTGGSVMPMLLLAAAMFGAGAALLLAERRRAGLR